MKAGLGAKATAEQLAVSYSSINCVQHKYVRVDARKQYKAGDESDGEAKQLIEAVPDCVKRSEHFALLGLAASLASLILPHMAQPYIPPPPPYEPAQGEFDQKVSHAIEVSLATSDHQPRGAEEDEPFDEAAFEAAFEAAVRQRESQGGSSNNTQPSVGASAAEKWHHPVSPTVQPLRIHKKKISDPQPKERPSWYVVANLDEPSAFQPLSGPSA